MCLNVYSYYETCIWTVWVGTCYFTVTDSLRLFTYYYVTLVQLPYALPTLWAFWSPPIRLKHCRICAMVKQSSAISIIISCHKGCASDCSLFNILLFYKTHVPFLSRKHFSRYFIFSPSGPCCWVSVSHWWYLVSVSLWSTCSKPRNHTGCQKNWGHGTSCLCSCTH